MSIWLYLAIAGAALLAGLSKGGLGGTVVALVTPMLALALPATDALGVALVLLLFGDCIAMWMYWRCWNGAIIGRLLPGTIVGVVIGSLLLPLLTAGLLRTVIGLMVLAYCLYKVIEPRIRREVEQSVERPWYAPVFGAGTGLASTLANAGGPIVSVYFLIAKLTPLEFIGTSAPYYSLLNCMKIPGFLRNGIISPAVLLQVAWAVPLVPLGAWIGRLLIRRWQPQTFERVILILLVVTALFLLIR